ncbi:MAG: TIGR01244 family sulfur transferase [Pontixanthobacter sp.]
MNDFKRLSATLLASPQITEADVAEAKAQGVTAIINNRPDGESPDQTPGDVIAAAAREHGLDYRAIPVTQAGVAHPQIDAMADAIDAAEGTVLAYCRSGTRSAFLWALARAKAGDSPESLMQAANEAGYDLTPIRPMMVALAQAGGG